MDTTKHLKRSNPTADIDAQRINRQFNSVAIAIEQGATLRDIFRNRFKGNRRAFTTWLKQSLDISIQTATRLLTLHLHRHRLQHLQLVKLVDAYSLCAVDDYAPQESEIWWLLDAPPETDPGAQCSTKFDTTDN